MAVIETWYNQDLSAPVQVQYIKGNVFSQDNNGNLIGVNVYKDGQAATLSGSVSASVIRADGATVAVTGALSGNRASVTLPQACYAVPGVLSVVIKLTDGTTVTTLCAVVANVYQSSTDAVVDPGTIIPSIQSLISAIDAAIASIPADYSSLWNAIKLMNDGGNIDFFVGNSRFFNGYYSGSTYNGNGTQAVPPFSGWNVLLVHVVKGATITIAGMPTVAGAQSNWLNSETLTDVKQVAWNAQECNGTHECITEWLAMSAYRMDPDSITITYAMREDLQSQETETREIANTTRQFAENNDFAMFAEFIRQYISEDNAISGKYYWHNGINTSSGQNVYIIPPFRVYAGIWYSFINVYGYFCTLAYDDGTFEALTESTTTKETIYKQMEKNGWAYVTVYDAQLYDAMVVAGDSAYNKKYFMGYSANPNNTPIADIVAQNMQNGVGSSENISPWGAQSYTVNGNAVSYNAPSSGNTGFYISPNHRVNISKIKIGIDVESAGGGQMTVHIWDKNTSDFANHLYTLKTINDSAIIDVDLATVSTRRPSLDLNNWVVLLSNTGNSFTFNFNSITIYTDSGVPNDVDGNTLGEIIGKLYGVTSKEPLYIECGAGKQYTRLRDAIQAAETIRGSTVVVYPGVYDLTNEFAAEIAAASGDVGIELSNDVYVKFLSGAYVKALFPESSVWISDHFQPFYAGGSGFVLDGANIEAQNCRYCVHDERGGADVKYHNVYKNCRMKFTLDDPAQSGGTRKYMQCIGGGLGKYGYIEIDGGHYTTVNNERTGQYSQQPISYHNGYSDGCDSKIFIKDVYLADEGIIRLGCYGSSTIKTPVYV